MARLVLRLAQYVGRSLRGAFDFAESALSFAPVMTFPAIIRFPACSDEARRYNVFGVVPAGNTVCDRRHNSVKARWPQQREHLKMAGTLGGIGSSLPRPFG